MRAGQVIGGKVPKMTAKFKCTGIHSGRRGRTGGKGASRAHGTIRSDSNAKKIHQF